MSIQKQPNKNSKGWNLNAGKLVRYNNIVQLDSDIIRINIKELWITTKKFKSSLN